MSNARDKNSKTDPAPPRHIYAADLHGISRLGLAAVEEVIDMVETLHARFLVRDTTGGITGFAYRRARATTAVLGRWMDARLDRQPGAGPGTRSSPEREAVLAALNGVVGDFLSLSGNALAIPMRLRRHGQPLALERTALAEAIPEASGKLLILAHGLCRCDLQWRRNRHDHGEALARDLGYTPLYLHYNSGRHVSVNGRELSGLLDTLVREWPVPVRRCRSWRTAWAGWSRAARATTGGQRAMTGGAGSGTWFSWERRTTAHRWNAPATGSLSSSGAAPLRRRSQGSVRCAAPALPTCATAIWSMRTGKDGTASSTGRTTGAACPCRRA